MNERIKELSEQATETVDVSKKLGMPGTDVVFNKEKFAELIVKECIQVCKIRVGNSDYNTGRMHCASDIAEYFGMRTPGKYEPKMPELTND